MTEISRNGSHLQKQAAFKKQQFDVLKWVRFEEIGHTSKNGLCFQKNDSHLRNQ